MKFKRKTLILAFEVIVHTLFIALRSEQKKNKKNAQLQKRAINKTFLFFILLKSFKNSPVLQLFFYSDIIFPFLAHYAEGSIMLCVQCTMLYTAVTD